MEIELHDRNIKITVTFTKFQFFKVSNPAPKTTIILTYKPIENGYLEFET